MTILYQHPGILPLWQTLGALLILVSVSIFSIRCIKIKPYFTIGWFWFLGTLIPVIGIIQIGSQAMADRYMYIPSIGLFIIMAWGGAEMVSRLPLKKILLSLSATVFLLILTVFTWKQLSYWENSIRLFEHALEVAPCNAVSHNNLANALEVLGRVDDAIKHYRKALGFKNDYFEAHSNLATALEKIGRTDEAIQHYIEALRITPDFEQGHYNLANLLEKIGRTDQAIQHYGEALRIEPNFDKAHNNLGVALLHTGDIGGAEFHFREALRINPDYILAKNNLENLLNMRE
jgi:tetratricopeptide (TPR) repeat protein